MRGTVFVFLSLYGFSLAAEDIGTLGKTYEIKEKSLLAHIQDTLRRYQREGKIKAMQQTLKKRVLKQLHDPAPVAGIGLVTRPRSFYYDPTVTLGRDIRDHSGRLLYPKGTRINPFDTVSMSTDLVFIKGEMPSHLRWATAYQRKSSRRVNIILVSGPLIRLMRKHKKRFYFDQQGRLSTQLGIRRVPAVAYQEGRRIRIDEVPVR